mgnify:CR=1 FL=1
MSGKQFRDYVETIHQQLATLEGNQTIESGQEISAALEEIQLIYEEMQTSLEAAEVLEQKLFQQNQQIVSEVHHYYNLFHSSLIADLVTDANGLILEANQAIATLLNVPQTYLVGKPLAVFVAEDDRRSFRTVLNQLPRSSEIQTWEMKLCPRKAETVAVQLQAMAVFTPLQPHQGEGAIRMAVYNLSEVQQKTAQFAIAEAELDSTALSQASTLNPQIATTAITLPQSLDGLRVLIVDDEADARDFITAVLEAYGIRVTAVATAAAALQSLEEFHPDVLVSDVRMPYEDGYSLIRKVRELEAQQGGHIPAAALTAYLTEDREKALSAGFEAHLHKLAQPTELIAMVAQLAGRTATVHRDTLN